MKTETIKLDLAENSYDIIIGSGIYTKIEKYLKNFKEKKIIIITDSNIEKLYLKIIKNQLKINGFDVHNLIIEPGEKQKSFIGFTRLANQILSFKPDRSTLLIALGGGVIGDLTGFLASVILRGIDFIQIPTTLLSQVDSSVGGKTGINTNYGKNLIGSFYQPKLVLIDTNTLDSLSEREFNSGYVEACKYSLINNKQFFDFLENNKAKIKLRDKNIMQQIIKTSCQSKADIVAADQFEKKDQRALLNLGHTFGHAIEHNSGYQDIVKHGEAVAIGIILAFQFSEKLLICQKNIYQKIEDHFKYFNIPTHINDLNFNFNAKDMYESMIQDKKTINGNLVFILAEDIGKSYVARNIAHETILEFLKEKI